MSNLPTLDSLKVAQRHIEKLSTRVAESEYRETKLEILAETLRDERDAARAEVAVLKGDK